MRPQLPIVRANRIRPLPLLLTVGLALATALTLSCSSGSDDGSDTVLGTPSTGSGGTVTIGGQVWLAKNLDVAAEGSKCYNNKASNCTKYGRLYDWATAMNLPSICNATLSTSAPECAISTPHHKGICPSNFHIPTEAEWAALKSYVESDKGCSSCDGKHLKSTTGWDSKGNGQDTYGFAALSGGNGYSDGDFYNAGYNGRWWSTSEGDAIRAYIRNMYYNHEYAIWYDNNKSYLFSVRCLQD